MPDQDTETPQIGDDVTLVAKLLFDDNRPRHGTVIAVQPDGNITARFPHESMFVDGPPMHVTSNPEHFVVVRKATTKLDDAVADAARLQKKLDEALHGSQLALTCATNLQARLDLIRVYATEEAVARTGGFEAVLRRIASMTTTEVSA